MSYLSQRGATGGLALTANGIFQQYTPQTGLPSGYTDNTFLTELGTRWDLEDGREAVLVLAGASNLAQGKLMQDAALIANHQNLVTTAFQAYANTGNTPATVTVTLGGTAATVNQYQLGYAVVTAGTGLGQTLQIASHPAQATTTGALVITLADAPNVALDTTSTISLVPLPGFNVIINPITPTNVPRGVTLYPITAGNYGFLLSKGTNSCLIDTSAPAAGKPISPSSVTAGAVAQTRYATNVVTDAVIGQAIVTTTSAQYQPIVLDL